MYRCQDTGVNSLTLGLKLVLQHWPFILQHFGVYFTLIGETVAKIRAKTFLRLL